MAIEPGIPVPGVVQTDTNRVEIFVIAQICRQAVTFVLPVILADQGCIQRPKLIAKILIQRQLSPVTPAIGDIRRNVIIATVGTCLLYTSDAADDLRCVDFGGRRIIKQKNYIR